MRITCSNCGKELNVPDSRAGKKGRCPGCKSILPIPKAEKEDAPFGLAPLSEPEEKVQPLLFDRGPKARCADCGIYVSTGDVLCDRCAGRTSKQAARTAEKNMRPKEVDSTKQPGYSQVQQLLRTIAFPLTFLMRLFK